MISFDRIIAAVILIWAAIYTGSYAVWTWKRKNKLGAVMVMLLAATMIVLPVVTVFFLLS